MSKLLIFDADSIIFTVAWKYRTKKTSNLIKINTNKFISDVLRNCKADDYIGFYGAKGDDLNPNFRYAIDPKYKANRPPTPDFVVKWGPVIRAEFEDKWGFRPVEGMEADDAVAIAVKKYRDQYDEIVVATFDKDLKQIPDITFYNMKKHEMEKISEIEADKNFYIQMLMGDSGDNIPGIKGIGKKGAPKILENCDSSYSYFRTTALKYKELEDDIRVEELNVISKEIKDMLDDVEVDTSDSEYNGLNGAKLDRKIRINAKIRINEKVDSLLSGGWKAYYNKQYGLLRMLVDAPDFFTIPDVTVSPVKEMLSDITVEVATESILDEGIDDFLTI